MGSGFILHTKNPFYLGRIIKLKPLPFTIVNYINEFKPLIYSQVEGYIIIIAFAGSLEGYKVRVNGPEWEAELKELFNQMANWMLTEKIHNNKPYYSRFKSI